LPEIQFGITIFCFTASLLLSGGVLWLLGKKSGPLLREPLPFPAAFLAGSFIFSFVYILNRLAFPARPKATAVCNLLLLSAVIAVPFLKKKIVRRRTKAKKRHPLYAESVALEHMLELDPLNAFCFEKLSEIYEKMGRIDKALEAARGAVRLDSTINNQWRVEDLTARYPGKSAVKDKKPEENFEMRARKPSGKGGGPPPEL